MVNDVAFFTLDLSRIRRIQFCGNHLEIAYFDHIDEIHIIETSLDYVIFILGIFYFHEIYVEDFRVSLLKEQNPDGSPKQL